MGRADNDTGGAERRGNIDNCFGSGGTDRVTEKGRMTRVSFAFCFGEDGAGFRVLLPFAFRVVLGHERLLAHKQQIKPGSSLARFAQGEVERAACAANCAEYRLCL